MPTGQVRRYATVECSDCHVRYEKRADSLARWNGRCRGCTGRWASHLPQTVEAQRQNGLAFIRRFGKLAAPKMENRRRGETHWHWRKSITGERSGNWRGGVTPLNQLARRSLAYRLWRLAVFARDKFACVECGDGKGGNLNADHIKPFSLFPELRLDVDNGRTLCVTCHRRIGAKGRTKAQVAA